MDIKEFRFETVYTVQNFETKEVYRFDNTHKFCKMMGIDKSNFGRLLKGVVGSSYGYILLNVDKGFEVE